MLEVAQSIARTDTGRHRSGNEDAAFVSPPVFVLADGMGGAQSGEVASKLAVDQFVRGLPQRGSPAERLVAVAQRANAEIYRSSVSDPQNAGMGTTLTAAYLDADSVVIAHVGDSRAYLLRDGELSRLTEDHSLVGELVRSGRLTEDQAREHPQRSVITRALGIETLVKVDTWNYALQDGDTVLLCSDGLTDMISEPAVQAQMVAATSLDEAAQRLIDAANAAGGRDNITVVLFRVREADGQPSTDQSTQVWRLGVDFEQPAAGAAAGATGEVGAVTPDGAPPPEALDDAPTLAGLVTPEQQLAAGSPPLPVVAPPGEAGGGSHAPLARLQGWTRPGRKQRRGTRTPRHPRLWATLRVLTGAVALLAVIAAIGGGAYLASRQYYFLGTNGQGIVVMYRGVPYKLPFGVRMYSTYYESGLPAEAIPAARRASILNHSLRSRSSAATLVNDLELGQISG